MGIPEKKVLVGLIVGAQGIKGQVKIKPFLENPEDLGTFKILYTQDGSVFPAVKILYLKGQTAIAQIQGITDRTMAEHLKHTELFVAHEALPPLEKDTFYEADLMGLAVHSLTGKVLGSVVGVENYGAGPLLEVRPISKTETILIPFKDMFVPRVSLEKGIIEIDDLFARELEELS